MISSTSHQASLFYAALGDEAAHLRDDPLDPLDALLNDQELRDIVRTALTGRSAKSALTGRYGMAPDRVLRCCVLKYAMGLSFGRLVRVDEVENGIVSN
jgi:hypothetical protein